MTRASLLISSVVLAILAAGRAAEAQDRAPYFNSPPLLDISPRRLPPLTPGLTYAVDIHCRSRGTHLSPITDNGFIRKTYTTSHALLISSQQATSATIAPGTLPANGLGMTVVYVTDGTAGSELDNRQDDGCKSTFLIRRQTNVFLIPFISLHSANQAGVVLNILSAALTPFASLFSLITGGPLAATASSRITNFQSVETGFNSILGKLNEDYNYARTVPLGVGTTTITTSESVATVKVRPLSALITDRIDDFSNALRTLADSETVKVTQANPSATCNQLSNNVALDGITASEDRAYILGYEGLRTLQNADEMMHCLGRLAKVAANIPAIWAGQQADMIVTPEMAEDFLANNYPAAPQLAFSTIEGTLENLMNTLGKYSRNGQPPSATNSAALRRFFVENVNLVDSSATEVFKSASIPTGFPQIIDFLVQRGFYRFGCYAQTTNQTGLAALKVNSIFLAFKASPNATTAKKAETLAIHPIFSANKYTIQTLDVSDNVSWIASVLAGSKTSTPTTFACGELTVE